MLAGYVGQDGAKKGKASAVDGKPRQPNAAQCDGRSRLAPGRDSKTPPPKKPPGQHNDAAPSAMAAEADRQANGVTPNGSGGVVASGQRLLAAQAGASTLDPRRSDD